MIMTFDFLITARENEALKEQLEHAMSCGVDSEVCTDIHKLTFLSEPKVMMVAARTDIDDVTHRIIPKKITYRVLSSILNNKWDDVDLNEIMDI